MGSNEELGIAQSQIAATKTESGSAEGIHRYHERSIGYLNERILAYLFMLLLLLVACIWLTTSSILWLVSSFALVILVIVLWGFLRIQNIEQLRRSREQDIKKTSGISR